MLKGQTKRLRGQGAPTAAAQGFANAATEELKATNEQLLQENNENRNQINELTTHMQTMLKELERLEKKSDDAMNFANSLTKHGALTTPRHPHHHTPYNPTGFAPAPPQAHWSPPAFGGGDAMLRQMAHWNQQMGGPMMMPPVDVTQYYQQPPPPQGGQGDGGGGRGGNDRGGPGRGGGRGTRRGANTHDSYCHTHGFHVCATHNSATCTSKGPNHQDNATKWNRMGGSTRGLERQDFKGRPHT